VATAAFLSPLGAPRTRARIGAAPPLAPPPLFFPRSPSLSFLTFLLSQQSPNPPNIIMSTSTARPSTDDSFVPGTDAYARRLRRAQACVRTLLRGVGEDPEREGLRDTPKVRLRSG
jgi:hypothetical protein